MKELEKIQESKRLYNDEIPNSDFNETCEMIDNMYIDVYRQQISILTYWHQKQVVKVPDANDLLLSKVSSLRLLDFSQLGSNEPASYATQFGVYSVTHSAIVTQFYIEIFKDKCVDIKTGVTNFNFGATAYNFSIPKANSGGAVLGQNQNLTFTAYFVSNALQSIIYEMYYFKSSIYKLGVRRQYIWAFMYI